METHESFELPSPIEAAAALETARQARAVGYTAIPTWFFLVYGLMVAVLILCQLASGAIAVGAVGAYAVGVVAVQHFYDRRVDRAGIAPRTLSTRQTVTMMLPTAVLWITGALLDAAWGWIVGAVLGGCWTAGYGLLHNRRARAAA